MWTGVLVSKQKVDAALNYLLSPNLNEIASTFGLSSIPIYVNGMLLSNTKNVTELDVVASIEGGKTYLETLNELLNQLHGFITYIPQLNRVQVILPVDSTYTSILNSLPTSYSLTSHSLFADFEINTNEDVATQIRVKTDLLEAYPAEAEKYWTFIAEKPETSIQIPANSISEVDISFSAKGFPSRYDIDGNIICDELTLGRYFIDKRATGEVGYITAPGEAIPFHNKRIYLTSPGWWLPKKVRVREAQLKLDGVKLIIENLTQTENYFIASVKISAIPLLEIGSIIHIWDNGKTPKHEVELKSCYLVDASTFRSIAERIVQVYGYVNSYYTINAELTEFRPDIFVGGTIIVSLPDTSVINSKALVKRVYHLIENEKFQTKLELALISNITQTYSQMQTSFVPTLASYLPIVGPNNKVLS